MTMRTTHELHTRRRGRNVGLGLTLLGFAAVVFAMTVVKIETGGLSQGYDHVLRPEMLPAAGDGAN